LGRVDDVSDDRRQRAAPISGQQTTIEVSTRAHDLAECRDPGRVLSGNARLHSCHSLTPRHRDLRGTSRRIRTRAGRAVQIPLQGRAGRADTPPGPGGPCRYPSRAGRAVQILLQGRTGRADTPPGPDGPCRCPSRAMRARIRTIRREAFHPGLPAEVGPVVAAAGLGSGIAMAIGARHLIVGQRRRSAAMLGRMGPPSARAGRAAPRARPRCSRRGSSA
jgi:hypothetical protein